MNNAALANPEIKITLIPIRALGTVKVNYRKSISSQGREHNKIGLCTIFAKGRGHRK